MTEQKKTQLYKNLLTAGPASIIARTIICPIERVEILWQISNREFKDLSLTNSIKKLFEKQGFLGLFKGNSASLLRVVPFSSIEFFSMEFYKNIFVRGKSENLSEGMKLEMYLICGTLTGLNAITFTYPLDVVRTRMASNTSDMKLRQTKFISSFLGLYRSDGITGLYKGYYITFIGSVPYVAIKQTTYEMLKSTFKPSSHQHIFNFLCGSFAGIFGTTLLYPTYMLKRVLQANSKL